MGSALYLNQTRDNIVLRGSRRPMSVCMKADPSTALLPRKTTTSFKIDQKNLLGHHRWGCQNWMGGLKILLLDVETPPRPCGMILTTKAESWMSMTQIQGTRPNLMIYQVDPTTGAQTI
jgi:hypothetical protein